MAVSTYLLAIVIVQAAVFVTFTASASTLTCYYCDENGSSCTDTKVLSTEVCGVNSTFDGSPDGRRASPTALQNLYGNRKASSKIKWTCIKVLAMSKQSYVYNTHKGCIPEEIDDTDICDLVKDSNKLEGYNTDYCGTCSDNLCNAATGLTQNLLISSIVLVPVFYKFFV